MLQKLLCLAYGILHHRPAKLLYRQKFLYPDGAIREMVLWQIPRPTKDRPHGLKYRLYYGLADGTCMVRYWCQDTFPKVASNLSFT